MEKIYNYKIDNVKAMCIISVICAHTTSLNNQISRVLSIIGIVGVPCFFFISGYLYGNHENKLFKKFIAKKFIVIIIPWIILGTITFLINSLCGSETGKLSLNSYTLYLIGYHSHLYYLTMIILYYIIFWKLSNLNYRWINWIWGLVSIMCVSIIDIYCNLDELLIYPYLNPIFWIGFFSLGINFKKMIMYKSEFILKFSKINISFILLIWSIAGIVLWKFGPAWISYFSILAYFFELSGIFLVALYCIVAPNKKIKYISALGQNSLFIYLTHIVVIGFFNIFFKSYILFDFIKPIITVFIYIIIINISQNYIFKLSVMEKIGLAIGIKK